MENLSGRVIKGYELRQLIGEGGFGAVYLASQRLIGREVAVKIILPQYANHPDFIRRFETEAQLVARLEHPHIVPLYDYWREPTGAFLVMRFLRGGSLNDSLQNHGAWTVDRVSVMLAQISAALAVAHRQGIVHRDLKPENILLDENGNAYLSDFGIAKDLGGKDNITQNNAIVGSPAYISPEQIRGHTVTPQSDIYMLGLLIYEMLSGAHPFANSAAATLMFKHLSEPLPDISEANPNIPPAVNAVIQRATAKEPTERYAEVIELANDFRRAFRDGADRDVAYISSSTLNIPEPENPYKGLRAFQQADAADFFGRDSLTERLLNRLNETGDFSRFLAVVGPSGSGKSSVVKAGVIPQLQRGAIAGSEDWFIVEMVPGIDPMEELEATLLRVAVNPPDTLLSQLNEDDRGFLRAVKRVLPGDNSELLLIIDQFEELFTLVDDEAMRTHFMNSLIAAVNDPRSRVRVIITLRADFYDRPLSYVRFGELMQKRTEIVLPLTPEEIERAINGPADRAGLIFDRGLVTTIVADVKDQPGALPLLQYALTELFERREGRTLTASAYRDMGGTLGALAQRADELYEGLGDTGQEIARQFFLRLVTLGEGTEDTRRRVQQSELISVGDDPEETRIVLDAFGRYRLLTFDRDPATRESTVEVAHEALIRKWSKLRQWLDESREDLRMQRRLLAAAEEWRSANRDASFLIRGIRLDQFEEWARNTTLALNQEEREFLQASLDERQARIAEEKARQQREQELELRSRNRLRALVAVMAGATILSLALMVLAITQGQEAERARAIAERKEAEAKALALASSARNVFTEGNGMLALRLAIEASEAYTPPSNEVVRILANTAYAPGFVRQMEGHTASVMEAAFSPDGARVVSASADGTLRVWEAATGREIVRFGTDGEYFTSAAFSPDGARVVSGEAITLERNTDARGNMTYVNAGLVRIWDATTGEEILRLDAEDDGHSDIVTSVRYSADGRYILTGSLDRTLIVWSAETGEALQRLTSDNPDNFTGAITAVAISADGRLAISGHVDETIMDTGADITDRTARLWDTQTGEQLHRFMPRLGFIRTVDITPDGRLALTGSWSGSAGGVVSIWDTATGEEVNRLPVDASVITAARFSPDGRRVMVGGWGRNVSVWDISTSTRLLYFEGFADRVLSLNYSPDGQFALVTTGNYGNNELGIDFENAANPALWLLELEDRSEIDTFTGHQDWVWEVDMSADGRFAASGGGSFSTPIRDGRVLMWDTATGEIVQAFGDFVNAPADADPADYTGHTSTVDGIAFSSDATQVLSGGWDGRVILWDVASGGIVREFVGHEDRVFTADISPNDRFAASGDRAGELIVWDMETGEIARRLTGGHEPRTPINHVTFSPDSARLLSSGDDRRIVLWDVESGEVIRVYEGHTNRVNTVAFNSDGTLFASTAWDATVRLWDVASGQEIRQFVGHNSETFGVAFSPDDQSLLSGSSDRTVRLWDIASGQEIMRFMGHTSWIQSLRFHPSGDYAISAAQDNTLRTWRTTRDTSAIIRFAEENRIVRDLTCAERVQYLLTNEECD